MSRLILLNSVEDAQRSIQKNHLRGAILCTTHTSVEVFLKEKYAIKCIDLSRYISPTQLQENFKCSYAEMNNLIDKLDKDIGQRLNQDLGVNFSFFKALYSYAGLLQMHNLYTFVQTLKQIVQEYGIKEIDYYNCKMDAYLDSILDVTLVLEAFFENQEICCIGDTQISENRFIKIRRKIQNILEYPMEWMTKCMKRMEINLYQFNQNADSIVFMHYLYDLVEMPDRVSNKYDCVHIRENFCESQDNQMIGQFNLYQVDYASDNKFKDIITKSIIEDFKRKLPDIKLTIRKLSNLIAQKNVKCVVWGNSPVWGVKAVINEYFRSQNIPVIGAQHGGTYGDSINPLHFNSDYTRCDYFMSYGFTKEDLDLGFIKDDISCEIISCGRPIEKIRQDRKRKTIDLLYPLTNASSMLDSGVVRTPPYQITENQIKFLEFLNEQKGLNIYIKLPIGAGDATCSVLPILKRLNNLKIVDHGNLKSFLKKYTPKAVLLDFPSTPLCEVIHEDAEIFLVGSKVHPFTNKTKEMILKRVYYSDESDEIIHYLKLFFKNKLPPKRNDEYFREYIYNENRGQIVDDLISKIVNNNLTNTSENNQFVGIK